MGPKNSIPRDKLSPTNLVCLDKWSLEYSFSPGEKAVGIWKYRDQIGWQPFVQGDQILGGHLSRGINFMGIVCPESGGPEVRGSNEFGTKCVAAEFIDDFLKYY